MLRGAGTQFCLVPVTWQVLNTFVLNEEVKLER